MTEREKIIGRIRALREKTVANGCTEDEAIAAAAKVAEMLDRYNVTIDEVELRRSPFARHAEKHGDAVGERLWKVADGVAQLTGAVYWISPVGVHPVEVTFFGFEHEVEVARYLLEICAGAMRREQNRLLRDVALLSPARRRRRVLPFLDGMADRLRRRLIDLKPPAPTGRGLVVLHDALVRAAMAEAGLNTKQRNMRRSHDHEASYRDGLRAADGVALNRGLAAGRPMGLLQ